MNKQIKKIKNDTLKQVKVKNQICRVETLSEWIESRMKQIRQSKVMAQYHEEDANVAGRLSELSIILEKINDGRIQEIGKVKFKAKS